MKIQKNFFFLKSGTSPFRMKELNISINDLKHLLLLILPPRYTGQPSTSLDLGILSYTLYRLAIVREIDDYHLETLFN